MGRKLKASCVLPLVGALALGVVALGPGPSAPSDRESGAATLTGPYAAVPRWPPVRTGKTMPPTPRAKYGAPPPRGADPFDTLLTQVSRLEPDDSAGLARAQAGMRALIRSDEKAFLRKVSPMLGHADRLPLAEAFFVVKSLAESAGDPVPPLRELLLAQPETDTAGDGKFSFPASARLNMVKAYALEQLSKRRIETSPALLQIIKGLALREKDLALVRDSMRWLRDNTPDAGPLLERIARSRSLDEAYSFSDIVLPARVR